MGLLNKLFGTSNEFRRIGNIEDCLFDADGSLTDENYVEDIRSKSIPMLSTTLSYTKCIQTYLETDGINLNNQQAFEVFILLSNFVLDQFAKDGSFPLTTSSYTLWLFDLDNFFLKEFDLKISEEELLNYYNKRFIDLKSMMELLAKNNDNSIYVSKYFYRLIFQNSSGLEGDFGSSFTETQMDVNNKIKPFKESEDLQLASKFSRIFFRELVKCDEKAHQMLPNAKP